MDTLTHALSGALLARATAHAPGAAGAIPLGRRIGVGFLAAAFPDLDFVAGYFGDVAYLYYHRGITHSLILLPLWAWLLSWLCAAAWRKGPGWRAYFGVMAWSIGIHIAGDWITSFGTMLFAPLSDARYGISATFIIDLWFSGIIVAALAVSLVWRSARAPAIAGLAVLCGYVAFQVVLQQRALTFGEAYARGAGLTGARVTAMPRPVSPYNWMVAVEDGELVHYSFVNLARREPVKLAPDAGFLDRLSAQYLPLGHAAWNRVARFGTAPAEAALAREAWRQPQLEFFRWFAAYPVLHKVETGNPGVCVWFQDLRFFTPGRDAWPFRYGLCREAGAAWNLFRLVDGRKISVY